MRRIKPISYFCLALLLILFLFYFFIPSPQIPPLPNSVKSEEAGDTVQIKGVSGFYTDLKRNEVINFYQKSFSLLFFNYPFLNYRINRPPEESKLVIRDQLRTSYLEEIVHPFRETLIVDGFEPAVLYKDQPGRIEGEAVVNNGRTFFSKVTVRYMPVPIWKRMLVFGLLLLSTLLVFRVWKRIILAFRRPHG